RQLGVPLVGEDVHAHLGRIVGAFRAYRTVREPAPQVCELRLERGQLRAGVGVLVAPTRAGRLAQVEGVGGDDRHLAVGVGREDRGGRVCDALVPVVRVAVHE